uniref:allantoinase AllB n=1 Tax=uncultured Bilophila sp. TaxID=529385 RepID=UPI0025FAD8DE|nr:allantoinase AllB [uncultured Bilophila sp.]
MFDLAIRNGTLVTADRVFGGHLYVRNGTIAAISDDGTLPAREELDAAGLYVLPGMLDCHAHINDPGFTWREDLPHASEAAAVGGVTTLIDMPLQNTPPLTSAAAFANKRAVFEGRSLVDYAFWGGLVTDNTAELAGMDEAGAVGFKAFIAPVSLGYSSVDMGLAREALFRIKGFGGLAGFHCEDHALICAGEAKAKAAGGTRRAFLDSRPVVAELIATANVIELARETGARVHICHVSHPRVAELVRRARAEGLPVTGETCPHYLVFTEENLLSGGTAFKCAPPLRTAEARDGLWEYVLDGTLSCVGSDHSPSRADEKDEAIHGVMGAWGGLSGLQSLVQVMFDQAVTRRGCSPSLLARFAASAAELFGLDDRKGALGVGLDADAVLIDPARAWTITAESLRYLNPFSAFEGLEGVGLPVCTVVRGRVVAREGEVLSPLGHGLLQTRRARPTRCQGNANS